MNKVHINTNKDINIADNLIEVNKKWTLNQCKLCFLSYEICKKLYIFIRENNQTTTKTYISDIHDKIIVEYVSEKGDCLI